MSAPLARLKKRRQFLRVAENGRKSVMPGLILQARAHDNAGYCDCAEPIRLGLTVSKRVGNAVERNRARRRLREAARRVLPEHGQPHTDYVLIGRRQTLDAPFDRLSGNLVVALGKLNTDRAVDAPASSAEKE